MARISTLRASVWAKENKKNKDKEYNKNNKKDK